VVALLFFVSGHIYYDLVLMQSPHQATELATGKYAVGHCSTAKPNAVYTTFWQEDHSAARSLILPGQEALTGYERPRWLWQRATLPTSKEELAIKPRPGERG
jgi:hypothetical protein